MVNVLEPEYFSKFRCIGSKCEDTCCADWAIEIDKKTYQTYRKVHHSEMAKKLQKFVKRNRKSVADYNYGKFLLDDKKKCSMLLEDGLCSIHKELGEAFLCNTCATYPRQFVGVGDFLEKSLNLSCPEATRMILLCEEGLGFIEKEELMTTHRFLSKELHLEKYPLFWDLRVFSIQLMQNRQHPIEIRLIILGLFLQKISQYEQRKLENELPIIMQDYLNRLDNEEFIESLHNLKGDLKFQLILARDLIAYRLSSTVSEKYSDLLKQLLDGLALVEPKGENDVLDLTVSIEKYEQAYDKFYVPFMEKQSYMLENYVVNYIFKNTFPYDYETIFESYNMLMIHFALIKLHIIGVASKRQQLTEEIVVECVQQFSKMIEHNSFYLQGVLKNMEGAGYTTMGHMFLMIKH